MSDPVVDRSGRPRQRRTTASPLLHRDGETCGAALPLTDLDGDPG